MKKLLVFTFLIIGITANAQYKFTKAVLTLNDGKTLEGEARLIRKGYGFNSTISEVTYRAGKGAKKTKYDAKEVDHIIFTNKYMQEVDGVEMTKTSFDRYVPVDTKRYGNPIFLQEIMKDKLSLYAQPVKNYKSKISTDIFPANLGEFTIVYIKREDASAELITVLGLEGVIQEKIAVDYLYPCPLTQQYVMDQGGNINAVELTNFYNKNCN
ncbi:hypothetical protein [Nonlabens spongiae]|nr:hypothetical protein [Nonlabens spongiae]